MIILKIIACIGAVVLSYGFAERGFNEFRRGQYAGAFLWYLDAFFYIAVPAVFITYA